MANVLKTEKQIAVIAALAEGSSIRLKHISFHNMAKEIKPKRGRPTLPKGEAKGKYVPIRLSEADVKAFTQAMKKSDQNTLSGWMRETLRQVASNG